LVFLLFHKNFRLLGRIKAGDVIVAVLAVYLVLSFYEVFAVLSITRILAAA
jgi:F0F1-type ATP synthase membrane subunit a